jgi:acetyltransferase-like isoleucine patch superfamily enzyme
MESSYSFDLFRSEAELGARIGEGASAYLATMFDVGPNGQLEIGRCALVNGARIICDTRIEIGDYALISWNVVLMDTYRAPIDAAARREVLRASAHGRPRHLSGPSWSSPIRIGANVWIGFDSCVLPGVTIGEGSIIGARSVVAEDIPPYVIAVGNPARIVRALEKTQ